MTLSAEHSEAPLASVSVREPSAAAVELIRQVLRGGAEIEPEYPLVFNQGFGGKLITLEECEAGESRVRSTCAILVRELATPQATIRVGLIGSVATDPEHRSRGLASKVLAAAESRLQHEGCLISLLWADDPEFYTRRGYVSVGCELDFIVGVAHIEALPVPTRVRAAIPADYPRLHVLYESHPERVLRSLQESVVLYSTPGMGVYVREEDGEIVAFICEGRGADLAGVVHEWAGDTEDVLALVRWDLERQCESGEHEAQLVIMAPASATNLHDRLEALQAPGVRGVLGMAKLIHPLCAATLLCQLARPLGALRTIVAAGAQFLFEGPDKRVRLSPDEVLLALLAPRGERQPVANIEEKLGVEFPDLPLLPFIWGLDSI